MTKRRNRMLKNNYIIEMDADPTLPFKVMVPDIGTQEFLMRARFLSEKEAIVYAESYIIKIGKCPLCTKVFNKSRSDQYFCSKSCRQKSSRMNKKRAA